MRHTGDSERVHDSDWEARDDGGTWVGDPSFEAGFAESGRMGTQADTGFAKADLERDLPTLSAGSWNSARGTVSAMGGGAWPQPSTSSSTGGQSVETMPTTPSSNYQYDQWDSLALPPQTPLHSSTTQSQQSLNQNHNVRTHFHSESNEYTMLRRASDSRLYVSAGNGNQEHRYHPHPSLNPISEYNQQANSSQSSPLRHPSSPSSFIATTALSSHLQVHSGAQASNNFNHTNRGVTNSFNAPLSASPLVVLPALPSQQAASNSSQHLRSRTVSANFPHSFSSSSSLGGNLLASVDQKHLSSIESLWAPPSLDTLFLASTSSSLTGKQQVQPRRQVSSSSSFENRDIIDDLAFASSSPDSIGNYGSRVSLLGPHPASSVFGPPQSIALASQTGTRYRSTSASSSFSAPASGAAISSDNLLPAGKMGLSVAAPEYKPLTGPASGPGLRVQAPVYTPLSGLSMPGSVAVVGPSQPVVGGGGSSTSEQVGGMVGAALEGPKAAAFIVAGPANVLVGDSGSTMPAGAAGMNGAETKPEDVERMIQERGLNPNPAQFDLRPVNPRFFVIKSFREDHVFKSIKYNIWASTEIGNKRLHQAFKDSQPPPSPLPTTHPSQDAATNRPPRHRREITPQQPSPHAVGPVILFFSVNGSGHFCGVAQMTSGVDWAAKSSVFSGGHGGGNQKWEGVFGVRWVFLKDVPNSWFKHLRVRANENKPVTNSRDTQELPTEIGYEMLKIFGDYERTTCILDDWNWYEKRESGEKRR